MNAGAHGGQLSDVVDTVEVFHLTGAGRATISGAVAGFAYRRSDLPRDAVVTGARLTLTPGDPAEIRAQMDEARRWRRETQPIAEPNCGSVFTNPPGEHAAALIDAAGLKGTRIGGASVSMKHANFIVASPGASARDVRELIELIRKRVADATGVWLEPEVRAVGGADA
jgi:UDP-N-acetylmuramate dehydrogenase